MGMVTFFLPEELEEFVVEQVTRCGYGTRDEYIRELILMHQERVSVRGWLAEGAAVPRPESPGQAQPSPFDALRNRVLVSARD